jgi:hypothetical protein
MFRNSRITDQQIAQMMEQLPMAVMPDGTIRTFPMRVGFCSVFRKTKDRVGDDGQTRTGKYEIELLAPGPIDLIMPLYGAWYQRARQDFGKFETPQGFPALDFPFQDQGKKQDKPGYTPGFTYFKASTQNEFPRLKFRENAQPGQETWENIVNEKEIYSGCWVVASLNLWDYDNKRKGVSMGLQMLIKVADDEHTYGGGSNPGQVLSGVSFAPNYSPQAALAAAAKLSGADQTPPALPGQPPRPGAASPMPPAYGQPPAAPPAGGYQQPVNTGAPPAPPGYAAPPAPPAVAAPPPGCGAP